MGDAWQQLELAGGGLQGAYIRLAAMLKSAAWPTPFSHCLREIAAMRKKGQR